MPKVGPKGLLGIAAVVWMAAGTSITTLGIQALIQEAAGPWWVTALLVAGAVVVFALFHSRVFQPLVAKHVARIRAYDEPQGVHRFFDAKGYAIMAVMMGGGIALRTFGLVPPWFIAFFYTGLGVALAFAGVTFLAHCLRGSARMISPHRHA
ncbi:MAG: hypothetical protein HFJ75_05975 [Eggerthellaceae bacterium]|nr:hypothetical protein [Eggerthellaceae bacterium]